MQTQYTRPAHLLAGFHAVLPEADVPELEHIGEQWATRRLFVPRHSHSVWEFYLQISGESCWDGPEQSYTLRPGGFFAAPPAVSHQMHGPPPDKHHFLFAGINLAAVLARLPALAAHWPDTAIVYLPDSDTLRAPFRQLIREVSLTLPHRETGTRLALDVLVLEASRLQEAARQPGAEPPSLTLRHPAVRRAKELLDHQPGLPWRLADLARRSDSSAHYLVECFTREVGVSPRQYLLSVRIRQAQEMLAQCDLAVTELALELGFSSGQHFAATFKRLTGETPLGYRTRQRNLCLLSPETSSRRPAFSPTAF